MIDHRRRDPSLRVTGDVLTSHDLEIEVQRPAAGFVVLRISGGVDLCTSFSLMESLAAAVGERPALLAVDLSEASFMDEAGVKVLESTARHIDARHTRLAVICPSDRRVWSLLQLVGLDQQALVFESAAEALWPWIRAKDEDLPGAEKAPV